MDLAKNSMVMRWAAFLIGFCLLIQADNALSNTHEISKQKIVVLVHGLMRTSSSMKPLGLYLEQHGYQVYTYSYPSRKGSIQQHSGELVDSVQKLLAQNKDKDIYFVTHSLGGIVTRGALSQLSSQELKNIKGLVMLAPPNKGSYLARISTKIFPLISHLIKPLPELSTDKNAYVHRVVNPSIPMAIIAGRYDIKVPVDSTFLNNSTETVVVSATHTYIMNNQHAKQLVLNFLEHGSLLNHVVKEP
jgi:esterase/lipase